MNNNERRIYGQKRFVDKVSELGGQVIGVYVNNGTPVKCICLEGHICYPRPGNVMSGQGMCRACAKCDPATAWQEFKQRVASMGGQVIETTWLGAREPHKCICPMGHECNTIPNVVQRGHGMCFICGGRDPDTSERNFREWVASQGGRVIGTYVNALTPVKCICANGHECAPWPTYRSNGSGMCRICAGLDPDTAETAFREYVTEMGGQIIGKVNGRFKPVECICPQGHKCYPRPGNVMSGQGMCRICKGKIWDAFYVVTDTAENRVKFGITSGNPLPRIGDHRRSGFDHVERLYINLAENMAANIETATLQAIRLAGIKPIKGREYYNMIALPLILDICDNWPGMMPVDLDSIPSITNINLDGKINL